MNLRRSIGLLVLPLAMSIAAHTQSSLPKTFVVGPDVIAKIRADIRSGGGPDFANALKRLRKDADAALKQQPLSVMEKKQTPPSGDKHDYMSLAPYWWPDTTKPNGLPYLRRDGEVTPERAEFPDRDNIRAIVFTVRTLSLAYYFTKEERYASHAATLLRTWFLDPATRMNPNVNYGQAVKGRNTGRGAGLIETSGFRFVVDAIGMLEGSKSWTADDQRGMTDWFERYFVWLRSSPVGLDEADSKNNHGTWYDVQCASIALFLGKQDTVRAILEEARTLRIASQVQPDGRMPLELARTKALGYTTMNLDGFCSLASLADRVGIDLWSFTTDDGRSIKRAADWALPFWNGEKSWDYKQIIPFDSTESYPVIMSMAQRFGGQYLEAAKKIPKNDRTRLLFGMK